MSLYVVTVFEDQGVVELKTFEELQPLVDYVSKTINSVNVKLYAFDGQRLKISKPPFRYLMVGEQQFPLFKIPTKLEEDPEFGSSINDLEETPLDDGYASLMDQVVETVDDGSDNVAPTLPAMEEEIQFEDEDLG